jgi:hypothetical protein
VGLTATGSQDKQESCAALSNVTAEEIAEAQQFHNNFSKLASPRKSEPPGQSYGKGHLIVRKHRK